MDKKLVLVTGGGGFVGRSVLRALVASGYLVRATWNHRKPNIEEFPSSVQWIKSSIQDKKSVANLARGCSAVIHLVGILAEELKKGITHQSVVVRGTQNIVESAREFDVGRIIYVSAAGARENARSKYHRAKWDAEEIVRCSGLPWTIFRPSMLFGPERRLDGTLCRDFVSDFMSQIKCSPVFPIPGPGTAMWQPLWVVDLARAMVASVRSDESLIVDAGGIKPYPYGVLLRQLHAKSLSRKPVLEIPFAFLRLASFIFLERLSPPPLTRDQLCMLEEDNIVTPLSSSNFFSGSLRSWEEGLDLYF